ncbi:MAG: Holliday junction resolvase RuvX [Candidatus Altimarinota bacterium]
MKGNGKILAIDYGLKKIGLAVSDSGRMMAFGRGILPNKDEQKVFAEIAQLVDKEAVKLLLIGLPLNVEGEQTKQSGVIKDFAKKLQEDLLKKGLKPEIDFIDEAFSSFEANNFLREIGASIEQKKSSEDELAAIFLIHRYIDFKANIK